jgi:WD40 repeat protein
MWNSQCETGALLGGQQDGAVAPASGALVNSGPRLLLAFMDGSVGVFDYGLRNLEFITVPAHSETIFDCRFKSNNPDILATASYDSTIKSGTSAA